MCTGYVFCGDNWQVDKNCSQIFLPALASGWRQYKRCVDDIIMTHKNLTTCCFLSVHCDDKVKMTISPFQNVVVMVFQVGVANESELNT